LAERAEQLGSTAEDELAPSARGWRSFFSLDLGKIRYHCGVVTLFVGAEPPYSGSPTIFRLTRDLLADSGHILTKILGTSEFSTLCEALTTYTTWAARRLFWERRIGSRKPGEYADSAV
jgi:hypothetical protein